MAEEPNTFLTERLALLIIALATGESSLVTIDLPVCTDSLGQEMNLWIRLRSVEEHDGCKGG